MDHIPRPDKPTGGVVHVPYASRIPYDQGDFLTYPARLAPAWSHAVPTGNPIAFAIREQEVPSDDRELEGFLQSWLFFGLLHAVLGPLYNEENYIDTLDSVKVVHTRNLEEVLSAYVRNLPEDRTTISQEVRLYLETTQNLLMSVRRADVDIRPGINPAIRTSIVSLYGVLLSLADLHLPGYWTQKDGFYDDLSQEDVAHMTENGWCPAAVTRATRYGTSLPFKRYIKDLAVDDGRTHHECNEQACQYESGSVQPNHTSDCRGCHMIGPDVAEVGKILATGGYPVLEITGQSKEDVQVTLHPRTGCAYVALSHIWSQGLGNEHDTKLPACQILRIQRYVEALQGQTFQHPDLTEIKVDKLYVWIDSLLCPRPHASYDVYQLALGNMRDVYYDATYVLVLDTALEAVSCTTIEALTRIHISDWQSRLWTLQEGALPAKLLIQFASGAVDYLTLYRETKQAYDNSFMLRSMLTPLLSAGSGLRSWRFYEPEERDVQMAFTSLSARRVRNDSDQPVCAAALLGLNIAKIVRERTLEERMCTFWRLAAQHCIIPSTTIFTDVPQLDVPGLRWAPAEIIGYDVPLNDVRNSSPARLTDRGLCVSFSGWRIHALTQLSAEEALFPGLQGSMNVAQLRTTDGRWFMARSQEDLSTQQWHVILDSTYTTGLLGQIEHGVFRKACRISLSAYTSDQIILAEAAWKHGREIGLRANRDEALIEIMQRQELGRQDEQVIQTLKSFVNGEAFFGTHIMYSYSNRVIEIVEEFDKDTMWCVD